jgi:hypothetical protein
MLLGGAKEGRGYTCPLSEMDLVYGFSGSHIGADYDAFAGDPVFAIAGGRVCYYSGSAGCMGGGNGTTCACVDGEVIFVRHQKSNGQYFIAMYAHIQNVRAEFATVTQYTENGPSVDVGEQIAEIGVYAPCRDCSPRCDHLHLGIWDSENQMPMSAWGYGDACWTNPQGCWVDPATFLGVCDDPTSYTYSLTYAGQSPTDPSGVLKLRPLETVDCWLDVLVGQDSAPISNDPNSPYYVELRSVDSSWINTAYSDLQGPDWQSWYQITPANLTAGSNETARFGFQIRTPDVLGRVDNLCLRLFHPHTGQYIGPTGWTVPVDVQPYLNIRPNIRPPWDTASALWKTYIVNMPTADRVTVFVTGEASYTCSGDDSDLKLVINGTDLGWNTDKALDGATLGRDIKTIATTHDFVQGNNTIQIWADRSPTLYNVLVVPYYPWLLCDMVSTIQAPGGDGEYLWFNYRFYVHVADTYTMTIKGLAGYFETTSDDDDAKFILDGKDYGYNNVSALDGQEQKGVERVITLTQYLSSGWRTLQVKVDRRPKITAIHLERGSGSVLKSLPVDPGDPTLEDGEDEEDKPAVPARHVMLEAYPNPFNPATTISYSLPQAGNASLSIYDLAGRRVATLTDGFHAAGRHLVDWDGSRSASGIYFLRLVTDREAVTRKLALLK